MILHQINYIKIILTHFNFESINLAMTPMEVGLKLIKKQAPTTIQELKEMKKIPYQNTIGSLMHYMVCTCLDIPFAIGMIY
jgi:hypothetical protein